MFQYFELCNVVSLTPNFLLFTKNFYDNLWEENKKFPYYFQQSGDPANHYPHRIIGISRSSNQSE